MPSFSCRTFNRALKAGLAKTTSILLAVSLRSLLVHLKYIPASAIVEINKSKMLLFPKKGAIHFDLFVYRKREPICTDYLMNSGALKEGDVVLDIGANIGYYALIESQLVGNNGKVYASEPVLGNLELLKINVRLNNLKNVQTFPFAFGERDMTSKIYVSNWANLCAIDRDFVGEIIGVQEVPMITVDTFFKDRNPPNLIRMDVEGYEYEIIKGMPQALKRNMKILVELHPFFLLQKLDEIFQILGQNNFKIRFVVFEDKVKENKIVRYLMKKGGLSNLPITASNISMQDLRTLINQNPEVGVNVLFEK